MRFDIAHTLEIPQGATELTTSQLEQISGGHQRSCKSKNYTRHRKSNKHGGHGNHRYGKYEHKDNYGDGCDY
jgi:hypothetical protein